MKELDRNDYAQVIAEAHRQRSEALGALLAGAVRAFARVTVALIGPRPPHHHMPCA